MKWNSECTLSVYTFSIDMDALLAPVYHLVIEMVNSRYVERPFYELVGDVFDVNSITENDAIDEDMTEESFLVEISRHVSGLLYANLDKLNGFDIWLLYEPKKLLIAPAKSKLSQPIISWIKKAGVMKTFLDLIKYEQIKRLRDSLVRLLNDQYFGLAVNVTEVNTLKATIIPMNALENYEILPIDTESIWVSKQLRKRLNVSEIIEYGEVKFPDMDDVSLMIGEFLVPLTGIDQYVKENYKQCYFWDMLKDIYASRKKNRSIYRECCGEFKTALKNSDFAKLMSSLQYNLYIKKEGLSIPEAYQPYFEEVYNIEEFIENSNQILFTGKHCEDQLQNKQTMLGIYNTKKDGTDYNLHAWLNVENEYKQKKTHASGVEDINIKTVYALKPQYSYYFSSTYFEDLFQEVLQELNIETLHDVELKLSNNPRNTFIEVDNLVRKTDGTIVFIENKTTLNRYNIEETLGKIAKFHQVMTNSYSSIRIEYMLVAPYMNETVEEAYSYFTNLKNSKKNNFFIPIARFNGVKLHCVIEPEYEKLKALIQKLLK